MPTVTRWHWICCPKAGNLCGEPSGGVNAARGLRRGAALGELVRIPVPPISSSPARTFFARRHLRHHASVGTPTEAEHVNFGSSPIWVFLLFAANGIPAVIVEVMLGVRIAGDAGRVCGLLHCG